jgi:membrane fusion protein, heavy metal efflux system
MKFFLRGLSYLAIVLVCGAAVAAAAYYVFDPRFGNAARTAEGKGGHGHGKGKEGDHHDEGVKLADAQIAAAGIELLTAAPQELRDVLRLNGIIQPNQEALVKVTPRFPGVIRSMRKRLGDRVRKDEILATVESNQSLTTYELKAPIDGTVIDRDGTLGEFASEAKPVFTIADLSTMWIDFAVFRRDFAKVRIGDPVSIDVGDGGSPIEAKIDYVSPIGASDTQSAIARAVVANDGRLRPGLFGTSGRRRGQGQRVADFGGQDRRLRPRGRYLLRSRGRARGPRRRLDRSPVRCPGGRRLCGEEQLRH